MLTNFCCCRLNFSTAFSTNVVSICKTVKLNKVIRIEVAIRYRIKHEGRLNKKIETAVRIFFISVGFLILNFLESVEYFSSFPFFRPPSSNSLFIFLPSLFSSFSYFFHSAFFPFPFSPLFLLPFLLLFSFLFFIRWIDVCVRACIYEINK